MTEKELDALEAVVLAVRAPTPQATAQDFQECIRSIQAFSHAFDARVALKLIRKVREQTLEIRMLEEHADKQHSRAKRAERRVSALEVAIDRIDAKVKQALERDE